MANDQFKGAQAPHDGGSDYSAQSFLINQMLGRVSTATLVRIVAVANSGELAPVGLLDVLPLVNQLDGDGNPVPHINVHDIPYFRLQGGANAVIIDPEVGDIGICLFADRDISTVKANKDQANPGSKRRHNMADGLYIGGVLNGVPTQYMRFSGAGIEVVSPTKIRLVAPNIELAASVAVALNTPNTNSSGTVTAATDVVGGGKSLKSHVHNGVQSGSSNTGAPV